ncbi:MAG: histidine kinase [Merdibacter sp.]
MLQNQINPHFLFNTEHDPSSVRMRRKRQGAETVLKTSQLLRYSLTIRINTAASARSWRRSALYRHSEAALR